MKKYKKPEIYFERFELSQQIASCDFDSNNTMDNIETCRFTGNVEGFGTMSIFMSDHCDVYFEQYCYHNGPDGFYSIFNS